MEIFDHMVRRTFLRPDHLTMRNCGGVKVGASRRTRTVCLVVSKITLSVSQNPKRGPQGLSFSYFFDLLGYLSSRISGNTAILDDGYRRLVSVCGRHTVHIVRICLSDRGERNMAH